MLTKTQKRERVAASVQDIQKSANLIFIDFSGVKVDEINKLKTQLREAGASFKVVKKRLLQIALRQAGIDMDLMQFGGQVGIVYLSHELPSVAGKIHSFAVAAEKEGKPFKVLGAYEFGDKTFLDAKEFTVIAKLPSREILIAQIMGGFSGPLRAFMSIVKQLSEKGGVAEEVNAEPEANMESEPVKAETPTGEENTETVEEKTNTE